MPEATLASLERRPVVSVVMPTYNTEPRLLEEAIGSVLSQAYPAWELCIADDGSSEESVRRTIERHAEAEERIKAVYLERNLGISAATNSALESCEGELVAFLDHDDLLAPAALLRVVSELVRQPQADVLYSDEDKLGADGRRRDPFFKPDFSPLYALGAMYVGHLLTVRRSLAEEVGGMDPAFDSIQDYEFLLRLSELTDRIHHIPEILYHWRAIPGSIAAGEDQKRGVSELQAKAVSAHLARRGIAARARPHPSIPHRAQIVADPARRAKASVVIAASGREAQLERCLRSVLSSAAADRTEVIAVVPPQHPALPGGVRRVEREPGGLHRAVANNLGAAQATGTLLVFLSDAIEAPGPGWIDQLALFAAMPGTGPVGPLLARPDGAVEQAGLVLGLEDPVSPCLAGIPADGDGYYGNLCCAREVSAVSAECMLVDRRLFAELGGFREAYQTQFEDFDFCHRSLEMGLAPIYAGAPAIVIHETAASRRAAFDVVDRALFVDCFYEGLQAGDRFYNPNLDSGRASFEPATAGGPG